LKCKAKECRKQFTVTIGSIFEDTHISCRQWLIAFHLMVSSKKGVSALQLQRNLGLGSYRTAWHLAHRIREAMKKEPLAGMLQGIVEADETYVGGKPRPGTGKHKTGAGTDKTPVMVLVERDGKSLVRPLDRVTSKNLKGTIEATVAKSAIIMTDQLGLYRGLNKTFARHEKVNHSIRQYAKRVEGGLIAHVNTAESFFALLKRGHYGVFHQLSKKHLHRYCNEFGFRWDHRHVTDGERMVAALKGAEGRRLTYRPLKGTKAG
jgi:transposase-like protein